jgi:hypothetical protein
VPGEVTSVSGVPPLATSIRVLHLHGGRSAGLVAAQVAHQRAGGWTVHVERTSWWHPCGTVGRRIARLDPDVVVLHGFHAGLLGRLAVRGRRPTVLHVGRWAWTSAPVPVRPVVVLWERLAARWANAVMLDSACDAARGVRRRIWVPPFVVGSALDRAAAVTARSQAFGTPSVAQSAARLGGRAPTARAADARA